ncbi:MAG: helix-turn-helix domain-containing protein [Planctomycetes bacterium]|nr:helix-turn-helix domain-containing protein [Planctomycetota bacterium]
MSQIIDYIEDLRVDPDAFYRLILQTWQKRLWEDELSIRIAPNDVCFEPSRGRHFHAHPEIFLQLSGSNSFDFPNAAFDLETNEIAIIPSGVPHGEEFVPSNDEGIFLCIVLMPTYQHLGILAAIRNNRDQHVIHSHMEYTPVDSEQLSKLLQSCNYFHQQDPSSSRHIMAAICNILLNAMERPLSESDKNLSKLIRHCRHLIHERFYIAELNVQRLAIELQCTPNYLSAKFKRESGISLSKFLNTTRLEHASELLINSELSIQHIAWSSGYNSCSYFISRFQEAFGETPGKFR